MKNMLVAKPGNISFFLLPQIHWFSIFNSFMMVIFLVGLVSMILMRTLRKDYARYSKDEELDDLVITACTYVCKCMYMYMYVCVPLHVIVDTTAWAKKICPDYPPIRTVSEVPIVCKIISTSQIRTPLGTMCPHYRGVL